MSTSGTVVLRRTWPQRLVILASVATIAGAVASAWFIHDVWTSITDIGRVDISGEILITDTVPGDPVNFLLIGTDSALGLDPDDPVLTGRNLDPADFQADSISILRVDPTSGQAWVLSIPRDLLVEVQGRQVKINSLLSLQSPEPLIEAITANFGIPVNHYVSLDFLGFREVVDTLDGIPVWFDNPARDLGSGLDIPTPGCHVLDGEQSLTYVRARFYEELIEGEWTRVGNSDFGRIERQQDFLVLALDRAIGRGARNPGDLAALVSAGAESIVLDSQLTVAELVDVGESFSEFSPENLERFSLAVTTVETREGVYRGELLQPDVNEPIFDVFRGSSDLPAPRNVTFDLYAGSNDDAERFATELTKLDFTVSSTFVLASLPDETVIVHPPGELATAETLARWLEPIPRVVEDPEADTVSLVFGAGHEQILFFLPHDIVKMRLGVAAHEGDELPSLGDAGPAATPPSIDADNSTTSTTSTTTTTTVPERTEPGAVPTTSAGIIGQAPVGESCG